MLLMFILTYAFLSLFREKGHKPVCVCVCDSIEKSIQIFILIFAHLCHSLWLSKWNTPAVIPCAAFKDTSSHTQDFNFEFAITTHINLHSKHKNSLNAQRGQTNIINAAISPHVVNYSTWAIDSELNSVFLGVSLIVQVSHLLLKYPLRFY